MSKKKKIIIILSVIIPVVVLLAVALTLVFTLKPGKADKPEVIAYDQNVYVSATYKQNYSYRFRFTSGGSVIELDSDSHIMEITADLWNGKLILGKEYSIQTCLVEQSGILAGDWSDAIEHTFSLQLAKPNVEYDSSAGLISWQSVLGADKYYVCYLSGDSLVKVETDQTQFDVSSLKGGERQIFITASSSNSALKESDKSNTISCVVEHELPEIISAYVNESRILSLTCSEVLDEVELSAASGKVFTVKIASAVFLGDCYRLEASIKGVYDPNETYSVRPKESAHNHFSGEKIEVQKMGA